MYDHFLKNYAIAGVDGVADALYAVKEQLMTSILQDANGQMQGSIDVALHAVMGDKYKPQSNIWEQYLGALEWNAGESKRYDIPWTTVTLDNADQLLALRK